MTINHSWGKQQVLVNPMWTHQPGSQVYTIPGAILICLHGRYYKIPQTSLVRYEHPR